MTVIRPNSVSGITSITAQANDINFFRSNGTLAGLNLNGVNFNTTSGISTLAALKVTGNLDVEGVLTYQDVTNIDSVGIITARSTIDAQGDVSIADKIIHTGDTNTAIRFPAADTITAETGGGERFRIDSTGNTHLGDSGSQAGIFGKARLNIRGADDIATSFNLANSYLHIGGAESTSGGLYPISFGHTKANSTKASSYIGAKVINSASYESTALVFATRNVTTDSAPTERLRILPTGRVGINQTSPEAMLQVDYDYANSEVGLRLRSASGSGTKTWQLSEINGNAGVFTIRNTTNSYNILNIDGANQRVGINKTNPEQELHVVGDSDACVRLTCTDGGVASFQLGDASDTVIGGLTLNAADNSIQLRGNNNSERVRIESGGNVVLKRGGISATPSVEIFGSGNASDADADNLTIHNWGDSDGDYWRLGVNLGMDANGNDSKPSNTLKGAGITIDGRYGRVFLKTSPSSSSTVYDSLIADSAGRVTKPQTPFVMVHIATQSGRNTTGSYLVVPWDVIHGSSTSSNVGSHFNTSNHRFTAPVAGRYLFVMSLNIVADNIIKHRINGSDVSKGEYRDGNDNKWDHADASFIYDMNANDYYDCVSQLYGTGSRFNGGGNSSTGWDTLSIYLLG